MMTTLRDLLRDFYSEDTVLDLSEESFTDKMDKLRNKFKQVVY